MEICEIEKVAPCSTTQTLTYLIAALYIICHTDVVFEVVKCLLVAGWQRSLLYVVLM